MARNDTTRNKRLSASLRSAIATAAIVGALGGWVGFSSQQAASVAADTSVVAQAADTNIASSQSQTTFQSSASSQTTSSSLSPVATTRSSR